jgi:hypothetical protein
LISLLSDEEERTRANASGALGNFARNSKILIPDLIQAGALHKLVEVATTDKALVSITIFSFFSYFLPENDLIPYLER